MELNNSWEENEEEVVEVQILFYFSFLKLEYDLKLVS